MDEPKTNKEAVVQAAHILNSVTLPIGTKQYGTDAGDSSFSTGSGVEYTLYGVLYDHINKNLYWRTSVNQSLQRLRFKDLNLAKGSKSHSVHSENDMQWFIDVSKDFQTS